MSRYINGARVKTAEERIEEARQERKERIDAVMPAPSNVDAAALTLAYANKHRPWARRWLRQNGEWF